jgi:hypothetical protein
LSAIPGRPIVRRVKAEADLDQELLLKFSVILVALLAGRYLPFLYVKGRCIWIPRLRKNVIPSQSLEI